MFDSKFLARGVQLRKKNKQKQRERTNTNFCAENNLYAFSEQARKPAEKLAVNHISHYASTQSVMNN